MRDSTKEFLVFIGVLSAFLLAIFIAAYTHNDEPQSNPVITIGQDGGFTCECREERKP